MICHIFLNFWEKLETVVLDQLDNGKKEISGIMKSLRGATVSFF